MLTCENHLQKRPEIALVHLVDDNRRLIEKIKLNASPTKNFKTRIISLASVSGASDVIGGAS